LRTTVYRSVIERSICLIVNRSAIERSIFFNRPNFRVSSIICSIAESNRIIVVQLGSITERSIRYTGKCSSHWNNLRKNKNTPRAWNFQLKAAVKAVDGSNYTPTIVESERSVTCNRFGGHFVHNGQANVAPSQKTQVSEITTPKNVYNVSTDLLTDWPSERIISSYNSL